MNMPAFQRKFPWLRNVSASSALGFSRKRDDFEDARAVAGVADQRGALLDVAKARAGPGGLDADGDEFAGLLRGGDGGAQGVLEGRRCP